MDPLTGAMAAASIGTGLMGAFRKTPQSGYSRGDIDAFVAQRRNEINQFADALSASRANYLTRMSGLQNYALGRFMPQIEAKMAGRGLQVSGGAYGSALAKQTADYAQQAQLQAAEMERADLASVENQRQSLYGTQVGAAQNLYQPQQDRWGAFLGQLSGQLGNLAYQNYQSNKPIPYMGPEGVAGYPRQSNPYGLTPSRNWWEDKQQNYVMMPQG